MCEMDTLTLGSGQWPGSNASRLLCPGHYVGSQSVMFSSCLQAGLFCFCNQTQIT